MPGPFCVSLTCAGDDPDRAAVAFVAAGSADKKVVVFLSAEGAAGREEHAADTAGDGFAPLKDLTANFAVSGAKSAAGPSSSGSWARGYPGVSCELAAAGRGNPCT